MSIPRPQPQPRLFEFRLQGYLGHFTSSPGQGGNFVGVKIDETFEAESERKAKILAKKKIWTLRRENPHLSPFKKCERGYNTFCFTLTVKIWETEFIPEQEIGEAVLPPPKGKKPFTREVMVLPKPKR